MEKSTQGVVEGARVSDAAGQALNEIAAVSRKLAGMIETISSETRQQAEAARKAVREFVDRSDHRERVAEAAAKILAAHEDALRRLGE